MSAGQDSLPGFPFLFQTQIAPLIFHGKNNTTYLQSIHHRIAEMCIKVDLTT